MNPVRRNAGVETVALLSKANREAYVCYSAAVVAVTEAFAIINNFIQTTHRS